MVMHAAPSGRSQVFLGCTREPNMNGDPGPTHPPSRMRVDIRDGIGEGAKTAWWWARPEQGPYPAATYPRSLLCAPKAAKIVCYIP
jgi:hypothetical protein